MSRLLRSPTLHLAAIGALLFAGTLVQRTAGGEAADTERPQVVVSGSRIAFALEQLEEMLGRPATPAERQQAVDFVVDQEVLYQHARRLGMDKEPVAEMRLAQIASFVAENPHEPMPVSERAMEAREIGLGHGDLVVRRIMIDGARRLIRGAVLVREPNEEALEEYLRTHPDEFTRPGKVRISHVVLLSRLRGASVQDDAREILERLRAEPVSPEEAAGFGDQSVLPPRLPELPERELARRFGHRFAAELAGLPIGSWSGPVLSKYGAHLVFVHERIPPRLPPLSEVRSEVRARARQQLADQYLSHRLKQLRNEFDVVVQGAHS